MPRFRYTATNEKGKTVRGLLEAPSEEALYAKLRNDGLYMTDAQEAQKAHATFRPLKTAVLADFCRNLGTLLTAGVPLVRAFRIMADERTIDARQKALYEAILSELRKGVPLSDAMESCAPAFPTLLLAMIRSAEGTGSIDHACARMATYYEREHKMNQQVGNSMMYPIILSVLIVGVIAILMTFVLPQFKPMFDQMEALPFLTQLLFDVSDFVGANWPVLLVVAALIVYAFFSMLLPQLYDSVAGIVNNAETYYRSIEKWVNNLLNDNPEIQNYVENVDKTFVFANPSKKSISIQAFEKDRMKDLASEMDEEA